MKTHNPDNERIKRQYFSYLKEAKRNCEASIDEAARALHRFESLNRFRSFREFHIEQAIAFKRRLAEEVNKKTRQKLSKSTQYSYLMALKKFFHWLAGQPGFKKRIAYSDSEYFNLQEKETRVAKAHREMRAPALEQVLHVLRNMPADTDIEKRDRALIAFILLTGARDAAVASLKLKHIDLDEGCVLQDAREVKTKFSKTFTTWFFPVGEEVLAIFEDWVRYLKGQLLWGPDDPLFPATHVAVGHSRLFEAKGLDRKHWSTAAPIRRIFKNSFEAAGLPYFNPHSIRTTLGHLAQRICRSPEEFKAWSQNLAHKKVLTTFMSYGEIGARRQAEIIRALGRPSLNDENLAEKIREIIDGENPEL